MKTTKTYLRFVQKINVAAVMAAMACMAGNAHAIELDFDNGWTGSWNTKVGVSAQWRAEAPEKGLISLNARPYLGGAVSDYAVNGASKMPGNVNYGRGDLVSAPLKFLTELNLSKGETAILVRAKGWYDYALNHEDAPVGNRAAWGGNFPGAVGEKWNKPLSDDGAPAYSAFDGIELLDAFVAQSFDVGTFPAQVRVGRQAINWGEGLFTRGLSQISPLDVSALRRPGTELKEALLPTLMLAGNIGLAGGTSLEAFYQLKWEPTALEYCGTFWNVGFSTLGPKPGGCNVLEVNAVNGALGTTTGSNLQTIPGGPTGIIGTQVNGNTPGKSGAWGLSLRFPVEAIDTEFALYALNVASTTPNLQINGYKFARGNFLTSAQTAAAVVNHPTLQLNYEEDVKIYGISATTNLWGASFGAELSQQIDVPVNYNTNDALALIGVATPLTGTVVSPLLTGKPDLYPVQVKAYEKFNKTQLIINGVTTLPTIADWVSATTATLIGEVGMEWNNLPDYREPNAKRFGRGGQPGSWTRANLTAVNTCLSNGGSTHSALDFCQNDGYATRSSWGYRMRVSANYSQVFGTSWSATPSLFVAGDVDGVSMDGQYQEGRLTTAFGLELDLNKLHTINLNYTTYSGRWNETRDHDNFSIAYTYSF